MPCPGPGHDWSALHPAPPDEPRRWDGLRCACGAMRLVWVPCGCGRGHLLMEPVP